jgi:hypothetical protein
MKCVRLPLLLLLLLLLLSTVHPQPWKKSAFARKMPTCGTNCRRKINMDIKRNNVKNT